MIAERPAGGNGADRFDERFGRRALQQETARTGAYAADECGVVFEVVSNKVGGRADSRASA